MDNIEAIALLDKALTAFDTANKLLTIAQVPLSRENQYRDTRQTALPIITPDSKKHKLTLSSWNCLIVAFFTYCLIQLTIVR
ncbi:MAG: hypothetical protein V7K32_26755 [Nostoc sp.]|uniref:hypothetical protein n=1 Tax=Nostoc sp. TaxID=1180 RepID=UPI002FF78D0B